MSTLVNFGPQPRNLPDTHPVAGPLVDSYGRLHSDLRISVTDRCNIRCFYCMPPTGAVFSESTQILSFDEILRFLHTASNLGVKTVRLTGGEPLLRPKLAHLIEAIVTMPAIHDVALTTNAVLLSTFARPLFAAGLRRLNIHLDSLDRDRFRLITRRDDLARVLEGINEALAAGFRNIKINAVAIKGLTEPDISLLIEFGRKHGIEIRFIEYMPLDAQGLWSESNVLTADEIIANLERHFGRLSAIGDFQSPAPATEYQLTDGYRIGIIASVSRPFCGTCNRLRLTADGHLRNCLFARNETNVRPLLDSPSELEQAIRAAVWSKRAGHGIHDGNFVAPARPMYSIGG